MSTDHDLPDEVEPAKGWEYAGRELLSAEADRLEEQAKEISIELRQLDDPSCGVPKRGTTHDVRQLIYRLERIASIVEELDPSVGDGGDLPDEEERAANGHDADASAVKPDSARSHSVE